MSSPADNIIALYERHARDWDRLGGRRKVEAIWLDRFAELLPESGARLLDIGCGCGSGEPVARYLIGKGHCVTGLDASPTLISLCRERFPAQRWIEGDMRRMALGQRFDGLLAWNSFFHLTPDDQRGMFAIFRDHAAPGAALMSPADHSMARRSAASVASRCITAASTRRNTDPCLPRQASPWLLTRSKTRIAAASPCGWRAASDVSLP